MSGVHVSTIINGDPVEFVCQPGEVLLDVLRNRVGLTGAKEGCGTGDFNYHFPAVVSQL